MTQDTNTQDTSTTANALIVFSDFGSEDGLLCAIVPEDSELAKHAAALHSLEYPIDASNVDQYQEAYEYVENWFADSVNKKQVCHWGKLAPEVSKTLTAIYYA